jgi:clan AA aspartic protease (TIGR02281 family)
MKKIVCACLWLIVLGVPAIVYADTVYLKNGRSMEGFIKKEDAQTLELNVGFGTVTFQKKDIERVSKSNPGESRQIYQKWQEKKAERQNQAGLQDFTPHKVGFERAPGRIMVEALLNEKVRASLLMDTGASLVVITHRIAEELGINPERIREDIQLQLADGRMIGAKFTFLKKVKVGAVEASNVATAVMLYDLGDTGFNDGLLGMSFLEKFNFRVDQDNRKLILERLR